MNIKKVSIILCSLIFVNLLSGCNMISTINKNSSSKKVTNTATNITTNKTTVDSKTTEITTTLKATQARFIEDYDFKYFKNDNKVSVTEITNGVTLVKNEIHKTNGDLVIVYALEVNLNEVSIVAGTYNNETTTFNYTKATPYSMATAFENETNRKVYASINADFFGATCCNAFVKDGYIIKNAHTTNGIYDYLDSTSDLPASAPMLFGVNDTIAQVTSMRSYSGDITTSDVKKKVVTSKLTYKVLYNGNSINSSGSLNFTTQSISLEKGSVYALVDLSDSVENMKVLSVNVLDNKTTLSKPESNRGYLYAYSTNQDEFDFINNLKVNDKVALSVKSATNTWNGYETILGCRQAIIIDGEIPFTVELENSNGVKNTDVPKSAVGVKEDGTVVIFAVESLYYGKKASNGDSHGVSLKELAEFMQYYNIQNGANFDGGGSTQLIVRDSNVFNKVVVRSSDTGSYKASESRKVMNSLLVVERKK